MKTVSVIVRTKNEEFWIGRCLEAILAQVTQYNIEIVLVDNESSDGTIERARAICPDVKVCHLIKYNPSVSLNIGVQNSTGDYCVCISAHCVPANNRWLHELIKPLADEFVCGSYGRQIPLLTSNPNDKRDLWLTFALDDVLQKNDPFIHNANAAYRRSDLIEKMFDENLTNIEDRSWGQARINEGKYIYYTASSVVYHDHGIHQSGNLSRLRGVIGMMDLIHSDGDDISTYYGKPEVFTTPKKALFLLVSDRYGKEDIENLYEKHKDIVRNFSDWDIFCFPISKSLINDAVNLEGITIRSDRIKNGHKYSNSLLKDLSTLYLDFCQEANFYDFIGYFDVREEVPSKHIAELAVERLMLEDNNWLFGCEHSFVASSRNEGKDKHILAESGWTNYFETEELETIVELKPNKLLLGKAFAYRKILSPLSHYSVIDLKNEG